MTRRGVVGAALAGLGLALGVAGVWGGDFRSARAADVVPSFISEAAEPFVTIDGAPQAENSLRYQRIARPSQVQDDRDCPGDQSPQASPEGTTTGDV